MEREFSQEKKEEIYGMLDAIDDKEWESFMEWCGGSKSEFGDWADRLEIHLYTGRIDDYQNSVLDMNEDTRRQVSTIFENVEAVDRKYAEIFRGYEKTVKTQIARVKTMTQFLACMDGNAVTGLGGKTGKEVRAAVDASVFRGTADEALKNVMEYLRLHPSEKMLLRAGEYLRDILNKQGTTDPDKQQKIIDAMIKHQPQMLADLYIENTGGKMEKQAARKAVMDFCDSHYFGEYPYPKEYFDGIIKAYEIHKMKDGRFVLDNGGKTIGYGHDLKEGEDFSGGLSEAEALELAISDLDLQYRRIYNIIQVLNKSHGQDIHIGDFTENEMMFFLDFAYNRGTGLVERPELEANKQPYSSLALLIIAVSEKDDKSVIDILKSEVYNLKGEYRPGLVPRRMDEYEILKKGDYTRDYDLERVVWNIE